MSDPLQFMRLLAEALRGGGTSTIKRDGMGGGEQTNQFGGKGPIEQRRDGYRMYAQEKSAMGEPVLSYEEWVKQE